MSARRPLSTAGLLTLCLAAAPANATGDVAFVTPRDGDLIAGDTRFSFRVQEGAAVSRVDVYVAGTLVGSALPPDWSFRWTATHSLVGATILAVAFDASGDPVERVRIRTSDNVVEEWVDVKAVQIYPVVTDRGGRYVRGLTRESFAILDQGKPVAIEYFSEGLGDLELAIMLDTSRSMTGKLSFVVEAALRLIAQLRAGDRVSIYAFNHGLIAGPSPGAAAAAAEDASSPAADTAARAALDFEATETFVRGLVPGGGTALYDALSGVLGDLAATAGRKAVILFSDGKDEQSLLTLAQVVSRARESEAIVYTVGAGGGASDDEARRDLETLGGETGGQALFFGSYRKLDEVFAAVLLDLRSQYALSYTPPTGETGVRAIEVKVAGPGYRVRCRPSYYYEKRE
jgi:VWFA-related protein